ncbi:hypothetical protein [Pseudobacteriovorax antillogorgiicola]|uniref:Uncharacterized protein n=1 Tax=Pseudobacteriovorax antillogorgiicola TaxID=1513793 RepID=A0A1Y6CQW1_9BACT|nr:hypothetical protein [Pseudobacteriovorax antillogorgiicola]TCS46424.1 hypothetical protein EDD56_12488 [Pseudobacteriovorax antillogorgiicola]SMF69002.1 hypothetical protein SAMN06296036_12488 [Pseudobacteriovorax antillogorgiicola]
MLIDDVADAISSYVEAHPSRSLRTLSRRSGVSYSTIRRIVQKDVGEPSVEKTILPILGVFLNLKEIYSILEKNNQPMASFIRPFVGFEKKPTLDLCDLDQQIILEATGKQGTTRERIETLHGQLTGAGRLEYLLETGLLQEIDGKIKAKNLYLSNPKVVLSHIEMSARNFDIENIGRGSFYNHFIGSMSEQDFLKIKQLGKAFVDEIARVRDNPTPGKEVVVNLNILGDVFFSEEMK